jgi:hypothetical protein
MAPLRMFVPITKVDIEKRLVYGLVTAQEPDRVGEVCDYASTKPLYEKWSSEIAKASGGKSFGVLRSMHSRIAAGKVSNIDFDDNDKAISICAKVVDDNEWQKVEEGVYTGFSQGGRYVKRWTDPESGLTHYTAEPTEISLVDLPCLPSATFSVVKADGATELRKFKPEIAEPPVDDVFTRAEALAKAAGHLPGEPLDAFVDQARRELAAEAIAKAVPEADPERATTEETATEGAESSAAEGDAAEIAKAAAQAEPAKPKPGRVRKSEQFWSCNCPDHRHTRVAEAERCIALSEAQDSLKSVIDPVQGVLGELQRALGIPPKAPPPDMGAHDPSAGDPPNPAASNTDPRAASANAADEAAQGAGKPTDPSQPPSGDVAAPGFGPSKDERLAQHKTMTAFHAAQDGPEHMSAAASHADAYNAHCANAPDAEARSQHAFLSSRQAMGATAKSAGVVDLVKRAMLANRKGSMNTAPGAPDPAEADTPPTDPPQDGKAAAHLAMATFHSKQAIAGGSKTNEHMQAAAAHADAHMAHAAGKPDADAKSKMAFERSSACMSAEKALEARALAGWAPLGKAEEARDTLRKAHAALFARLGKGLGTVGRIAFLIEELYWVAETMKQEAAIEGDQSPVVSQLENDIRSLCNTLVAATQEETREIAGIAGAMGANNGGGAAAPPQGAAQPAEQAEASQDANMGADEDQLAAAASLPRHHMESLRKFASAFITLVPFSRRLAKAAGDDIDTLVASAKAAVEARRGLEKLGRRNSAADLARLQQVHDLTAELGAHCGAPAGKAAGAEGSDALEKDALALENATLRKALADHGATLQVVLEKVKQLEASPAPAKAKLFVVSKAVEASDATGSQPQVSDEEIAAQLSKMTQEQRAAVLMKGALANPTPIVA